jgi:hypothetical protein
LSKVEQKIIELESEKAAMLRPALHKFELEKKRLVDLIKQSQDEYILKGLQETRTYRNKVKSYTTRLTEVEGRIIIKETQAAVKKSKRKRVWSGLGFIRKEKEKGISKKIKKRKEKAEKERKEKEKKKLGAKRKKEQEDHKKVLEKEREKAEKAEKEKFERLKKEEQERRKKEEKLRKKYLVSKKTKQK